MPDPLPPHIEALHKANKILATFPPEAQAEVADIVSRLTAALNLSGSVNEQLLAIELFRHRALAAYLDSANAIAAERN